MRKLFVTTLVLGCIISSTSANAAAKVFKNCTELNKVYPGGVALPGAVNAGGETKLTPKFNKKLYEANKKSDRDKDGIACEK
jgi:hypothetical protein